MRAVWISARLARAAKPLTQDEVTEIRGLGLFLVAWSGLLVGAGSIHEASSFVHRDQRSMPVSLKSGFALGPVAGWSWSSDATKIQRAEAVGSSALLRLQSLVGLVMLLALACFVATPNQSFNGTGLRPAR
jgi:hypothetical protein